MTDETDGALDEITLDTLSIATGKPWRYIAAREMRGYSQPQLAELVGISRSTLAKIECGAARPHPVVTEKIGKATGVSVKFLVGEVEISRPGVTIRPRLKN